MTEEEVVCEVENAFADVPYPGDDSIVERMDWEGIGIREDFIGKHWRDVVDPDFLSAHRLFVFFSVEGVRFYLPAYLIGLIRYPEAGIEWADGMLSVLYPPDRWGNGWLQRWDNQMSILSPAQKHSVRLVLEYMLETQPDFWWHIDEVPGHALKLAIANYWNQF